MQLGQHGSSFESACILALHDLPLTAPTPPTAPESVHSTDKETLSRIGGCHGHISNVTCCCGVKYCGV